MVGACWVLGVPIGTQQAPTPNTLRVGPYPVGCWANRPQQAPTGGQTLNHRDTTVYRIVEKGSSLIGMAFRYPSFVNRLRRA